MTKMILSAALMHGLGHQPGAWRVRRGPATDYVSPDMYAAIARKAEAGKLHVLFLAEQITNCRDDPLNQAGLAERLPAPDSNCALDRAMGLPMLIRGRYRKGDRHYRIKLENIGDVIHKAQRLAAMKKSDGRGVASGQHSRLAKAVKACRR